MNKVSIIIPVYNVEKEVKSCLESAINQTYENLEILVVNDGSTDGSKEICLSFAKQDKRIIYFEKPNGGLSDARNFGLERASGDYIFFLDSDDTIEKDCIETLYNLIVQDNSKIAVGIFKAVFDTGRIIDTATGEQTVMTNEQALECILYDDKITSSACVKLFEKSLFKDTLFPLGRLYEEIATTYKLIYKSERISFISKSLYNYLIRQNSITRKEFSLKKLDVITSSDEMSEFCLERFPSLYNACIRRRVWARLNVLTQIAQSKNNFKKEVKPLVKFIKKYGKVVLKDKKTPKRDKFAIRCLRFGFWFFKLTWKTYQKIGKKY